MGREGPLQVLENRALVTLLVPLSVYANLPLLFLVTRFVPAKPVPKLPPSLPTALFLVALIYLLFGTLWVWALLRRGREAKEALEAADKAMKAPLLASAFGDTVAICGLLVYFLTGSSNDANRFFMLALLYFPLVWNFMGQGRSLIDGWRKQILSGGE